MAKGPQMVTQTVVEDGEVVDHPTPHRSGQSRRRRYTQLEVDGMLERAGEAMLKGPGRMLYENGILRGCTIGLVAGVPMGVLGVLCWQWWPW